MSIYGDATAVVQACDTFLASYREALPRVARRGMQPVLDALEQFFSKSDNPFLELFRYPVENGLRATVGKENGQFGVVLWVRKPDGQKTLGWTLLTHIAPAPGVVVIIGLDSYREVSMEDLVELGIQPWEIVEHVKRIADIASFNALQTQATQKMGRA